VPPDAVPDDAPATVGDVRTLKRWLAVAGVWAVAASAIAIIALLKANDNQPKNTPNAVTGSQLTGVQRDLDQRIDDLEKKVKSMPSSDDLSKLDDRLKAVEKKADNSSDDLKATRNDLSDLKNQLDDLQRQQQSNSNTDTTTSP
jgi:septal ring factor EnvC (AmiA/AmiB activator)